MLKGNEVDLTLRQARGTVEKLRREHDATSDVRGATALLCEVVLDLIAVIESERTSTARAINSLAEHHN